MESSKTSTTVLDCGSQALTNQLENFYLETSMNVEQVLHFIDALVFARVGKHLNDLQRLLIQAAWSKSRQRYEQIAQATGYSVNYLQQDAAPKLWHLLSDVFGEKIRKKNFRAVVERQASLLSEISYSAATLPAFGDTIAQLESSNPLAVKERNNKDGLAHHSQAYVTQQYQDWGEAPDVSIFYERSDELAQLEQWIVTERCRLVGLVGMGGIGKTYLSVKLTKRIQKQFDYVIWRTLRHAPPLQQTLTSLLRFIANTQERNLPVTVEEKLSYLIDYLRKHRCLIVLDNVEAILGSGDCTGFYKEGYEDYGDFLKRLGECSHNSCLVVTSREKPEEIALMQGETLPVRCLALRGLSASAGGQLLQLKGCHWTSDSECRALIEQYSGNPLALNIVALAIQELFEGCIGEFLNYKTLVLDEIRTLLEQHLHRLPDLGNTILYWLAINREPISVKELQFDIHPPVSQERLIETLKSLVQRSLIEKKSNQFSLPPVLMEYMSRSLIERVCQEIVTGELVLLNSHALFKTQSKDYSIKNQSSFIIQPLMEKLFSILKTKNQVEFRLELIRTRLQAQPSHEFSYAAENILNLLCQLLSREP